MKDEVGCGGIVCLQMQSLSSTSDLYHMRVQFELTLAIGERLVVLQQNLVCELCFIDHCSPTDSLTGDPNPTSVKHM